jgi:hypothetical protein
MKTRLIPTYSPLAIVLSVFLITGCDQARPTTPPVPESTSTAVAGDLPIMHTTMGDFVVSSTRLVDQTKTDTAPDGYKFVLIGLEQSDGQKLVAGKFSFEAFQTMLQDGNGGVYILTADGTKVEYGGMGGWLDGDEEVSDDFVFGFLVPVSESYTLYWMDNAPLSLSFE